MSPARRRLLGLARPYANLLGGATAAGFVSLACGLSLPLVSEHLINDAIRAHHHSLIVPLALVALALSALRACSNFLRRWLSGLASVRLEASLRMRLFAHLQGLPASFHDHWDSGQLLARATSDLETIKNFVGYAIAFLGFMLLTGVGVIAAIAAQSPVIAGITALVALPWLYAAARFNRIMEDISAESRDAVGQVTTVVAESTSGVRILKAFGVEDHAIDRFDGAATRLRHVNIEAVRRRSLYIPLLNFIPNTIMAVVLGVGGFEVIGGTLSLGGMVAITQYLYLLIVPMRYVGWMLSMAQQAQAASERVFEILSQQADVADRPGATALDGVRGEIRFDRVTVRYPGAATPALDDVSFVVAPGETVAVVGATGSGKSTVAALVPRFMDPSAGRVSVDGHDVREVTLGSLRARIGVVFDEPILFSASVAENIAFAQPDATPEEVEAAARAAGAHGFVSELPDGYATLVGEHGFSLSGGQRQRLALARAIAARPAILILDDPLSSVDVRTEAEIEANLRALLGTRTTLIIAHRASTVAMADRVLLLDEGRLVASGRHHELLATSDVYRRVLAADLELEELA